jgi:DNA-binding NarL/FixJ family response regulator
MNSLKETTILIAEAEPIARLGLLHLINQEPALHVCGEACSLSDARDMCAQHLPDIVVLDLSMGDGLAFIKDLPQWSPLTKVVIYTTVMQIQTVQRAFKAGALGYVSRRDSGRSLLTAILGAVHGERHISPSLENIVLGNFATGVLEIRGNGMPAVSNRESQTLLLLAKGLSNQDIATAMGVSIKTVETHFQRLKEKLGIPGTAALRQYAATHAIQTDDE